MAGGRTAGGKIACQQLIAIPVPNDWSHSDLLK